jgi:PA domain
VNKRFSAPFAKLLRGLGFTLALAAVAATATVDAARVVIVNGDDPNVGYNDPTPAAAVGGNPGTTVGEQRRIAINYVAQLWGRALTGTEQTIEVLSGFLPAECDAVGGTLAFANTFTIHRDFDKARFKSTWYHAALANKISGVDLNALDGDNDPEAFAIANLNVGTTGCIEGPGWYYGLDGKAPEGGSDFVRVMLHEIGHGLGFTSFTDESTGAYFQGFPSVWEHFLRDNGSNKLWVEMTDAERVASAINNEGLVWSGFNAYIGAQQTLRIKPQLDLFVVGGGFNRFVLSAEPNFGLPEGRRGGVTGQPAFVTSDGCAPLSAADAAAVRGKIAVIATGTCTSPDKTFNAQSAGAIAVVLTESNPSFYRFQFGVPDTRTFRIPVARISQQDGDQLRANATRFTYVSFIEPRRRAGTDLFGRPLMFAPTLLNQGSSVSHWNVSASPNLVMEPFAQGDESLTLRPPLDLTLPLYKDIGW